MARRERSPETVANPEAAPFESALARLEAIVAELESGELALELSLARFEEGVGLARRCAEQLSEARQRIDVLMEENVEPLERAFEPELGGEG